MTRHVHVSSCSCVMTPSLSPEGECLAGGCFGADGLVSAGAPHPPATSRPACTAAVPLVCFGQRAPNGRRPGGRLAGGWIRGAQRGGAGGAGRIRGAGRRV